ncbi:MAG: hypothetical protein NC319_02465 [Butyricicoccus sp.]|nr:hypothetical protein [Butyricicoccus sp.]
MKDLLSFLAYFLPQFGIFCLFFGFPAFLLVRWCLRRSSRLLRGLVLAAMAACVLLCVYGLLRFTGTVILPGDNTYSFNTFDATWRDHGAALIAVYGAFLTGIIAAMLSARRAGAAK